MDHNDLRDLRLHAGLSQQQMAVHLGVSRVQVSRIERGVSSTPVETVIAWHQACGYRLEAVGLEHEPDSIALARALGRLSTGQAREVLRLAMVWADLTDTERAVVTTVVRAHEHQQ